MSKLDEIRALREAKTAKVGATEALSPAKLAKAKKAVKALVRANGGEFEPTPAVWRDHPAHAKPSGPNCPTCGRFWTKGAGKFDKKAYMRGYMAERRRKTKPETKA